MNSWGVRRRVARSCNWEGELGGAVDGDEEVQPSLLGVHLGDVDVKGADRVGLDAGSFGLVPACLGQPGDAAELQAATQGGAGQVRQRGLQGMTGLPSLSRTLLRG